MAKRKVGTTVASPASPSTPIPKTVGEKRATAVLWAAVAAVAKREGNRDDLKGGKEHDVKLNVVGEVDGQAIAHVLAGVLSVNHDSKKASSANPQPEHVVALLLSKMSQATASKAIREIVEAFESEKELPEAEASLLGMATEMLKRLRTKGTTTQRGSVRLEYNRLPK